MRHRDNRIHTLQLRHTRNEGETIIEEVRVNLRLQLLQPGFTHMNLFQVNVFK
ncbi:hypothetical protein D3C74_417090 [compost metagenome]